METSLFLLPVDEAEKLPDSYGETHFPQRMERARRFARREDRLRSVGAGALIRYVLGAKENDLCRFENGKPYLPDAPLHFNLSHSGRYVLLVTDGGEVGADVELVSPEHLSLADSVLQPAERAWMEENPLLRFFFLWTLKESVLKQRGTGLSLPLRSLSVLPLASEGKMSTEEGTLFSATQVYDGHVLSVCTDHPLTVPQLRILTADEITNG